MLEADQVVPRAAYACWEAAQAGSDALLDGPRPGETAGEFAERIRGFLANKETVDERYARTIQSLLVPSHTSVARPMTGEPTAVMAAATGGLPRDVHQAAVDRDGRALANGTLTAIAPHEEIAGSSRERVIEDPDGLVVAKIPGISGGQAGRVLDLARRHLQMDVAFICEIDGPRQHFRAVLGDASSFGVVVGRENPLAGTYCDLMLRGEIPNVIPDVTTDERLRHLGSSSSAEIGSYVGVPLYYADGELYGTLCGLSHAASPGLSERDANLLAMLAELLVEDLDAQRKADLLRHRIGAIITQEALTVALQPIVDLASGRCLGYEALSRFAVGRPDEVFSQADRVGLGFDLEGLALRKAVSMMPTLSPHEYLSVNVTPAVAVRLPDIAVGMPEQPLDQIVLEITEHASVADYHALRRRLGPLRARGLRLAIDDAGAGYASLHHVAELKPDIIKIDRSLIDGIAHSRSRRSILTSFVLLALDCQATLVAEGIETAEDLDVVTSLGVEAAQGYLLGRPSTDPEEHARWRSSPSLLPR